MPIFRSLNVPLPFLTQTLLAMSTFLTQYWIHLTALVISAFLTVTLFHRYITGFRRLTDTLLLHVPLLRRLIMLYNGTQFCRTLRLTLHAGLSLSEGVHITEEITPNMRYRDVYASLRKHILQGEKMSLTLFRHTHLFPPMLPEMIETAENSGSLSDTLGYLSEFYEAELDDATKNLSNSLEPILLIIMGLTVGLIAVAVITPLYEITRSMQRY